MSTTLKIPFENSYARLPEHFYAKQGAQPVESPAWICLNRSLAAELGIDPVVLAGPVGLDVLAGNRSPDGAEPLAMAYAGHQFGHFVPQLGDGRAILLGEVIDVNGVRRDIQLKGSGRTAFSRGGDGRAWLGPVIREYVLSEAMHALGVPTTRALAAVRTGETVIRETPLPGAIITRVASSHIRVGTFQYFAAQGDVEAVRTLADYAIARHYPGLRGGDEPYRAFLKAVSQGQARLIAKWLQLGFIHGVMNTDNTAISGETIDYGPCAFMDEYHPQKTFSSIDRRGRYAYDEQASIAQWNLTRLAETLIPLLDPDEGRAVETAKSVLDDFASIFREEWLRVMRGKFGLLTQEEADSGLIGEFFGLLERREADFTESFRALCELAEGPSEPGAVLLKHTLGDDPEWKPWQKRWLGRLDRQRPGRADAARSMKGYNPAVIPRNHLVERAIREAVEDIGTGYLDKILEALSRPYADQPEGSPWIVPPRPEERILKTFCGT